MKRIITIALSVFMASPALAADRPVVLELFTSQSCDSCPAADAYLRQLSVESNVLALSYHVDYWNDLDWKDTYSSPAHTSRQRTYLQTLNEKDLYTPELIVDGARSAVGSRVSAVTDALRAANTDKVDVPMTLAADTKANVLKIHIGALPNTLPKAEVIAIRYLRNATTDVKSGENRGKKLSTINNVSEMKTLGVWNNQAADYQVALNTKPEEGMAIILQAVGQGRILGAANQ